MVSARFSIQDNLKSIEFFEEIFLFADTRIEVILKIPFLFFSNTNVEFAKQKKLG